MMTKKIEKLSTITTATGMTIEYKSGSGASQQYLSLMYSCFDVVRANAVTMTAGAPETTSGLFCFQT